ncbi:MAG: hypothetical protein DRH17_03990 [Deltaproteobacteria bacterium]|nr:MAG: hypothetical protein DRH17_03990 [Deltaproteobacteria bacterium]
MLLTRSNGSDVEIFKEVSMGGRFGKYGDAKRKAQIRKNRLRPPGPHQRGRDKPLKGSRKSKVPRGGQRGAS